MDDVLITAYDLKHQIENMPQSMRDSRIVDQGDTEISLEDRIKVIIKYLEGRT